MTVHGTHCCKIHGCKYGHDNCPVEFGDEVGIFCEDCEVDQITIDTLFELNADMISEVFYKYHKDRYNPKSEHYRGIHFIKELKKKWRLY